MRQWVGVLLSLSELLEDKKIAEKYRLPAQWVRSRECQERAEYSKPGEHSTIAWAIGWPIGTSGGDEAKDSLQPQLPMGPGNAGQGEDFYFRLRIPKQVDRQD